MSFRGLVCALTLSCGHAATTGRATTGRATAVATPKADVLIVSDATTWVKAGDTPWLYSWSIDPSVRDHGAPAMLLAADDHDPIGLARSIVMHQTASATAHAVTDARPFVSKRVRFSASIRTEEATMATLWMRIDDDWMSVLCNRFDAAVSGTRDFTPVTCVLDVPSDARTIVFGVMLSGAGRAWVARATLDAVTPGVALTNPIVDSRQFDHRPLEPTVAMLSKDLADRCWEHTGPAADVRLDLRMVVEDGHAITSRASSGDPVLKRCLERLSMNWVLPMDQRTTVVVPFHLVRR